MALGQAWLLLIPAHSIAVRDKLFPAGKGAAADTHEFEGDPNFHKKASESHNPMYEY